jgi:hypothetical protein
VLLDVITDDPTSGSWSSSTLQQVADRAVLVINAIVYPELSVAFDSIESLEESLPHAVLRREHLPYQAAFLAGKAFLRHRAAGGTRRSPLPDFHIGAHAAVQGYGLLTRDAARYRSCFPTLDLIAPDASAIGSI